MTQLDERQLDPAIALASLDEEAPREPARQYALKHGDCFVVADSYGDIHGGGDGLFLDDTRILSLYRLTIGDRPPSLLGASLSQDNVLFRTNLTNLPLPSGEGGRTRQGIIHIERTRLIWNDRMYERIALSNYGESEVELPLKLHFEADFRDMFEVRGSQRSRRGLAFEAQPFGDSVTMRYHGLDDVVREATISFSQIPTHLRANHAEFVLRLPRRVRETLFVEIGRGPTSPNRMRFRAAAARARFVMRSKRRHGATIHSSGRVFNDWIARARADIALLTTDLATGPYPYAGIPWFSTAFGRDGVISALQMLWVDPRLARGVLAFLAQHQATEISPFSDAEPGKIMHETRKGEMAILKELPFGRYYGGVDTTPLYVYLACAYADRTGDMEFIDQLWPSIQAAAEWMDRAIDRDPNGFITYQRAADTGLTNQGWKDSYDSVFHEDGRVPNGPIALVEVQGYAFAAYNRLASLASRRGDVLRAEAWKARAEKMRQAVENRFWMEDRKFYAMAIDGDNEPTRVRTSNVGHLLSTGLPAADRAHHVAEQLLSAPFHTGWGIRTLAEDEIFFNPMSYHNGSIWPHDTAICAAGLARYGYREHVVRLLSNTFEAAVHFDMRLPELFCGFGRAVGEAPIAYPVACLPQAWSSGAVFMLLQACLGVQIDGWRGEVQIENSMLPIGIDSLTVRHLGVGKAVYDLTFQRFGDRVIADLQTYDHSPTPVIMRS
ncbi:amylo-alpha-1,6-glucosidase [Pseudaminobacter soli (ex Li et al. 2025)]|uniref:Amylo-alpha-1,6-glucosidase n=1 Tax=Pseudaminobacter soli (ex Li et al. 2025) TaxID=1295366 RepID=A0A2P7SNP0_9HYPH|nr:amylo-alpha-1,6-glucosidase [Mesorhizobium soli]PSJ63995.1 amylo-alpha-1,6-glucosidase [Mesorhizobium soli]